jgi:hypothetical protein
MSPKYQHCIRGRGTKFENLRSVLIFFQDCKKYMVVFSEHEVFKVVVVVTG